ncbi:MAG: murein biosynthesis integral membrane protein MurJ [Planctomycetaceae bacterium]|nr:murein biosynthesis integral membrane protein MurJ [Planctomycetaceae bacterium]
MGKLRGFGAVSLLTLVSRITGLGRDSLMAGLFGSGWVLDAFFVAFRIPNLFRRLFGDGAMTAAFLPEFVRTEQESGRAASAALFRDVAGRLFRILLALTVVCELSVATLLIFTPLSERNQLLCELTLIMTPYLLLICMTGLYGAALNGVRHFVVPAFAPVLLNVVWLAGGLAAVAVVSDDLVRVRLIALLVVVGGVAQLSVSAYSLRRFSISLRGRDVVGVTQSGIQAAGENPTVARDTTDRVFRRMVPVLFGLSVTQITGLTDSVLAWVLVAPEFMQFEWLDRFRLQEGTAAALYLGQRLFQFPMGVFAVALGTVLFPRFAAHAQSGRRDELSRDVLHGLQLVLIVGIPASVGLWFLADPISRLLFEYGRFDSQSAALTGLMISGYGCGVWVFSGLLIVNRVFYAANDQTTPMRQGIICVGMNLILDIVLLPILGELALPVATVISNGIQLALTLELAATRFLTKSISALIPVVWRTVIASALMYSVGQWTLSLLAAKAEDGFAARIPLVLVPIAVSVVAYSSCVTLTGLSLRRLMHEPLWINQSELPRN